MTPAVRRRLRAAAAHRCAQLLERHFLRVSHGPSGVGFPPTRVCLVLVAEGERALHLLRDVGADPRGHRLGVRGQRQAVLEEVRHKVGRERKVPVREGVRRQVAQGVPRRAATRVDVRDGGCRDLLELLRGRVIAVGVAVTRRHRRCRGRDRAARRTVS